MMRSVYVLLAVVLLASSIAAVSADSYDPSIIVKATKPTAPVPSVTGNTGAPALSGNRCTSNATLAGGFTIMYPNGNPVTVKQTKLELQLWWSTGEATPVAAILTSTGAGAYTFIFTLPNVAIGLVKIILPAGSLTDSFGTMFPNADVVVGTYTVPATSSCSTTTTVSTTPLPSVVTISQPTVKPQPNNDALIITLVGLLAIIGLTFVAGIRRKKKKST
jgi:hypothetical protein